MYIRLARLSDLPDLKQMILLVVNDMNHNGILIWNEFYPYEEFEQDIINNELYVMTFQNEIVGVFALLSQINGAYAFNWSHKDKSAIYISRLCIHPDYKHQGFASKTLTAIYQLAQNKGIHTIRLSVASINIPAVKLYEKNGFERVSGTFNEFSPTLNQIIVECGYERIVEPINNKD